MDARHSFTIRAMPADRAVDDSRLRIHPSPYQGEIFFGYATLHELPRQSPKRECILGDDHNAGSVLVQTVDNAGPPLTTDTIDIGRMMQKRIDQRAAGSSSRWVDNHPGQLIDNHAIVILIENT